MTSPQELIKQIREDSDKYSAICSELGALEKFQALEVTELYASGDFKSQNAAERAWLSTPNGQIYIELKWVIKGLEAVLRSKKIELRGLSEESHNQW
jgi:hypothetical protein